MFYKTLFYFIGNYNFYVVLNELEDIIDKGVAVPFAGRCLLDKEELLELLQKIRLKLPTALEKANMEANAAKNSTYQHADYLLENVETVVVKTIRDLEQCIIIVKENRNQLNK